MKKQPSRAKLRRGMIIKAIETPELLAVLEVAAVYYPDEPDEPYLEPKTVKLLDEARRRTNAGDKSWLRRHGAKLYTAFPAALVRHRTPS